MISFTRADISNFDKLFRINMINSLSGYKPANLIATTSKAGAENVAVFSSVVHLGSNPPLLSFILRPTTVPRNTYQNIKETMYYTLNHISEPFLEAAHHTSAKYPKSISEFDKTTLTPEYIGHFYAPFVKQSPLKIAMKYIEEYQVKANGVIVVVGEIQSIYIESDMLEADGFLNLSKARIATINSLDGYAIPTLKTRFGYQRPKIQ